MMKLDKVMVAGMCALVGGACAADDAGSDARVAVVSGRLAMDGEASGAALFAADDDGTLTPVATAEVAADGSFAIEAPPGEGPFVVQATGAAGVVGQVIVPGDLAAGDTWSAPISPETSTEAGVLLEILAGPATRADVDELGLMAWLDARVTARAQGGDAGAGAEASLGAAYMAAQDGWLALATELRGATTLASDRQAASAEAYAAFVADLYAETPRDAAETSFEAALTASFEARLGLSEADQAHAATAAGVLFEAALSGSSALAFEAERLAATASARAELAAQRAALTGSAAARARLEAAYATFVAAAAEASSGAELNAAWEDLAAEVAGFGQADSALALVAGASLGEVQAAIAATAGASADLELALRAALAGPATGRAAAVAEAFATFDGALAGAFAGHAWSAELRAFATATAAMIGAQGASGGLDLDALLDLPVTGLALSGEVLAGLGLQSGADGLVTSTFDALAEASSVVLVDLRGTLLAQGSLTATGYSFTGLAATADAIVELRDQAGAAVGAIHLGALPGEGTLTAPPLTEETTVEAQVLAALATELPASELPLADVATFIDAAVAATAANDVGALALAIEASSAVRAAALGATPAALAEAGAAAAAELRAALTTRSAGTSDAAWTGFRADLQAAVQAETGASAEAYHRAQAEAAATFEAVVEAAGSDPLIATSAARAALEQALALDGAAAATFPGSGFASEHASIEAAVDAFASATAAATSEAELDAAAQAFTEAMVGFGTLGEAPHGVLGRVVADLTGAALAQATLTTTLRAAATAGATFDASLDLAAATLAGAETSPGALSALTTAVATASATLEATLDLGDLGALAWPAPDQAAASSLVTHLALGFDGHLGAALE